MPAANVDLEIEQNAAWVVDIEAYEPLATDPTQPDPAQPIDMTAWTAEMHVRVNADDPDPVLALDIPSGRIVMGVGVINLRLTAAETRALTFRMGVYDLRLTPPAGDDSAEMWIRGRVRIIRAVTRPPVVVAP